jgi:hypothetical protein
MVLVALFLVALLQSTTPNSVQNTVSFSYFVLDLYVIQHQTSNMGTDACVDTKQLVEVAAPATLSEGIYKNSCKVPASLFGVGTTITSQYYLIFLHP